ncbi:MAG: phosphonate C-P lyase system protein PhnG [Pseudomonadota bacterium]
MSNGSDPAVEERKAWMGLLAKVEPARLAALWEGWGDVPAHQVLRAPEIGGVMVRGRTGAVGEAFNLGEMTVTRCSIRLATGEAGHAYVQGRGKDHALQAALIDGLMQTEASARVEAAILGPLRDEAAAQKAQRAAKAAATKVDFFTMVRGDN